MKTTGEIIKELRQLKGLSQLDLAKEMGYKDRTTVAKLESGENTLPETKEARMASVLGTSVPYLRNTLERTLFCFDVEVTYCSDYVELLDTSVASAAPVRIHSSQWDFYRYHNSLREVCDLLPTLRQPVTENKKTPDTLIDIESLSEDKKALVDYVMSLSDAEARVLRGMFAAKPQSEK